MAPPEVDRRRQFEATCHPFARMLYAAAVRLTRKPEDASDVVQETLLRAYRTFGGFDGSFSPERTLIYRYIS
jgi:RNA polymerase sigma-70 factor (ECF subfamily)